jgi:hypothetical protein
MHKVARHGQAARKAAVEATRGQSASTAKTKQQQALQRDGQSIKAETEAAKIFADINQVIAPRVRDQQRLGQTPRKPLQYSENYQLCVLVPHTNW